jgi:hypothetical protein
MGIFSSPTMKSTVVIAMALALNAVPARAQSRSDEVEIYGLALRAVVPLERLRSRQRFMLMKSTLDLGEDWRSFADLPVHPRARASYAKAETVENFLEISDASAPLPRDMRSLREFYLMNPFETRLLESRGHLEEFQRRKRLVLGTSVWVSGIGFDTSRTQALVYVSYVCGMLCGHAMFVMTLRGAAGWRVARVDFFAEY